MRRTFRTASLPVGPVHLTSLPVVSQRDLMAHFEDWVTDPDITLASLRRDFVSDRSLVGARYLGRYHVADPNACFRACEVHEESWRTGHWQPGRDAGSAAWH